jgi:hypothetical protein
MCGERFVNIHNKKKPKILRVFLRGLHASYVKITTLPPPSSPSKYQNPILSTSSHLQFYSAYALTGKM